MRGSYVIKQGVLGLILIAIGLIFLLSNVGVIDQDFGTLAATYWPVIFVIFALENFWKFARGLSKGRIRINKLVWGLGWLAIAAVLIGNKLNWFVKDISIWSVIWPIVIIFVGLNTIFKSKGRKSPVVIINGVKQNSPYEGWEDWKDEELDERDWEDWKDWKRRYKGKTKYYKSHRGNYGILVGQIRLGDTPWALENTDIDFGAGEVYMNISRALLEEGETNIDISGWVGSVTLLIPEGLSINVKSRLKVGETSMFGNVHSGNPGTLSYKSADYDQAVKKLNINVGLSIGEIKLKRVD